MPVSEHERNVVGLYDEVTEVFVKAWGTNHIHLALFEPDDASDDPDGVMERALERMVEAIVAPAGIRATDHLVDAGCGVGGTALYLARRHGCAVTGVNINRKQLAMASANASETDVRDRVRFEYADCNRHLPFADDSVDAVVNIESAFHYSDRDTFFREVRRILKPGGRIVASDGLAPDGLTPAEYGERVEPLCKLWAWPGLDDRATYSRRLAEAGLNLVEFEVIFPNAAASMKTIGLQLTQFGRLRDVRLPEPQVRRAGSLVLGLVKAAAAGFFELGRYCARKPA